MNPASPGTASLGAGATTLLLFTVGQGRPPASWPEAVTSPCWYTEPPAPAYYMPIRGSDGKTRMVRMGTWGPGATVSAHPAASPQPASRGAARRMEEAVQGDVRLARLAVPGRPGSRRRGVAAEAVQVMSAYPYRYRRKGGSAGPAVAVVVAALLAASGAKEAGHARAAAPVAAGSAAAQAIAYARGQLGKPYLWGGAGPSAFDCSGLVMVAGLLVAWEDLHNHAALAAAAAAPAPNSVHETVGFILATGGICTFLVVAGVVFAVATVLARRRAARAGAGWQAEPARRGRVSARR